jgi:hypothetical protein
MSFRRHSQGIARTRVLLRVLLIISLWQAPIPLFHCHSLQAEEVRGDAGLQQHLVRFHRGALQHRERSLGWHVHFDLPIDLLGSPDDDGNCPEKSRNDSSRVERAVVAETRLELSTNTTVALEGLARGPDAIALRAVRGNERLPAGNFLTTFVDSTTINVLVCVARC